MEARKKAASQNKDIIPPKFTKFIKYQQKN